jgi:hypothetical protein
MKRGAALREWFLRFLSFEEHFLEVEALTTCLFEDPVDEEDLEVLVFEEDLDELDLDEPLGL